MDIYLDPTIPAPERTRLQKLLREAFSDPARRAKMDETAKLLRALGGTQDDLTDTIAEQAAQRVENWREGGVNATAEDVGEIIDGVLDSLLSDRQRTVAAARKQRAVTQAQAQQAAAAPPARRPVAKPPQPTAMSGQRGIEEVVRQNAPAIAKALSGPARAVTLQLDEKPGRVKGHLALSGGFDALRELRT
jgi:hypothetical protein